MAGTSSNEIGAVINEKQQLVEVMHELAQVQGLSLRGAAFSSLKSRRRNIFGEDEDVIYFSRDAQKYVEVGPLDLIGLRLADLVKLAALTGLTEWQLKNELAACRLDASQPVPGDEALLHAVIPDGCILTARLDALLAIALAGDSQDRLQQAFGDTLAIFPKPENGLSLAQAWQELEARPTGSIKAVLLPGYDLAVLGRSPREAYQALGELTAAANDYLKAKNAWMIELDETLTNEVPRRVEIAEWRKTLSTAAGRPLILSVDSGPESLHFAGRSDLAAEAETVDAASNGGLFKPWPQIGRDLTDYQQRHGITNPAAPRLTLDSSLGMLVAGRTAAEAAAAKELYLQAFTAGLRAEKLQNMHSPFLPSGGQQGSPVPSRGESWGETLRTALINIIPATYFERCYSDAALQSGPVAKQTSFTGEVALVTGGASGIGKSCVEALLQRGAAVVTMDLNPRVVDQFDSDAYLGLVCDLTDEAAILKSYEILTMRFGGLDMLVLNAGIFPAGIRIEALQTVAWQKVMRINLDSNLVVMRETQPLLKAAPRYGRVLVNASKNVLAPGAGAAAYSASKAAVTQLARVAALEWGKDGIRVNMVHPDAIFDTGIWTEEVLKARAAHYGMTVQQYKTRNVLGVELNSHYVGELVAEMLGPLFEKITGAQIPVDGGSDRVI